MSTGWTSLPQSAWEGYGWLCLSGSWEDDRCSRCMTRIYGEPLHMDATSEPLDGQHNPQVSHERSDVSTSAILVFGLGLLVSAVVISLLIWWLFNSFAARAARSDRPLPTLATRATGEPVPPEPRLQVS